MDFEKRVIELDVNDVLPNRFQPRIKFNEESINELSDSIKEHGVIQPIVVRSMGDKYEIIAGERRYKASLLAGKTTIPAIVTNLNDKDSAEVALIENVQRKDLTSIEEAISYKKILDMGYLTQEELAAKLGKSQSTVANKLRLLNLDEDVQEAVLNEKISERHARSLLKLNDFSAQRKLLERIINERLTVRKTDEEIEKMLNNNDSSDDTVNVLKPSFGENPFVVRQLNPEKKEAQFFKPEPIIIDDDILDQMPAISEDDLSIDGNETPAQTGEVDPLLGIAIPTAPIEDASSMPVPPAPGFMNISDIENNAKDIREEEKPSADLNSLLKNDAPAVQSSEELPIAPVPEAPVEQPEDLKPAKFFNFDSVEEEKEEKQPTTEEEAAPVEKSDPFNFELNMVPVPTPAPSQTSTVEKENKIEDLLNSLSPASTPAVPKEPEAKDAEPAPVEQPVVSEVKEEVKVEALAEEPSVAPSVDEELQSVVPDVIPTVEPVTSEPNTIGAATADELLTLDNESLSLPTEKEEVKEAIPSPVEVERKPLSFEEPISSEDMPVPKNPDEVEAKPTNTNVISAVGDLRNKIKELESKGYHVDTEELDFENEYQFIVKIGK